MAKPVTTQAWKDIRYIASMVKGIVALNDELERAGSLDALVTEKEAKLDALKSQEAEIAAKLAAADAACTAKLKAADDQATAIVDSAEGIRKDQLKAWDKSQHTADTLIANANAAADKATRAADALVAASRKRSSEIDANTAEVEDLLKAATAALFDAEHRKAAVEAEIDRLKNLFKS